MGKTAEIIAAELAETCCLNIKKAKKRRKNRI